MMKICGKITTILIIISILFVVFCQTVVYSSFNSIFDITGTAYARMATDVRITDFKISEKYTSNNYIGAYEKFSKNTVSTSITFYDFTNVYYDVEVTNYNENKVGIYSVSGLPDGVSYSFLDYDLGTVLLDGIGKTTFTICFTGSGSYEFDFALHFRTAYNITYNDFEDSNYSKLIFENEEKVIDFKDEEVENISMLVNGGEYNDFIFENNILTFGPVDGDVEITKEKLVRIIKGNLDTIGSELAIGNEHFYVISSTDTSVTMLTKYNLLVGNSVDTSWNVTPLTNPTGIQDSTAIGKFSGKSGIGTVSFSRTNYWYSGGLMVQYGKSYPAYVYDSSSYLYSYVENYKAYLKGKGVNIENARLIKFEELEALGCNSTSGSCNDAPSWVYSTAYWSGSAFGTDIIWSVHGDASFARVIYSYDNSRGVRPVITVSKSLF